MLVELGVADSLSSFFTDGVQGHIIRLSKQEREEILSSKRKELTKIEGIFSELDQLDSESKKLLDSFLRIYRNSARQARDRFGNSDQYRRAQIGLITGRWKEVMKAMPGKTPEEAFDKLEDMITEVKL
jgi:flagellin-specific chaperone FliS